MKKTQLISWSLLFKQRFITVPVQKSISWAGCVWAPTVAQRLNICGGYRSRMHRMQIGKSIFQSAICIQHAPVGCVLWQHGTSHKMSSPDLMLHMLILINPVLARIVGQSISSTQDFKQKPAMWTWRSTLDRPSGVYRQPTINIKHAIFNEKQRTVWNHPGVHNLGHHRVAGIYPWRK